MIDIKIQPTEHPELTLVQPMELPELTLNGVIINHIETKDYEELENKQKINSVELIGNRQLDEIGINKITNAEIINLLEGKNL